MTVPVVTHALSQYTFNTSSVQSMQYHPIVCFRWLMESMLLVESESGEDHT
jgi:hypothetical protein